MNTSGRWAEQFLESRLTLWVICGVILCFFLITNLPWQLDDYDQAQQAFTSFEMIKQGDWFFQRTPHELIAQKPPFVGWVSAATFAVTRSWDVAWRLPSFLAAVMMGTILFRAALGAYGGTAALIALGAFGLNLLSVRLATLVRTDMPLALFLFLPGLLIWQKIRARERWHTREEWEMCVLLTVSMFIKGPMAFAFLLPGIVLFQWLVSKRSGTSAWCGWWPWLVSLGILAVWAVCGIKFVPGFYQVVFMKEFLGRFSTSVHRSQPFLYYLPHLLHKFAPWSVLSLVFAVLSFRRTGRSIRNFIRETSPETLWLVVWSLGGLLVMSFVPSKRVDRIYAVLPPLCLLLAAQVHGLSREEHSGGERVLRWSAGALLFSIVFAGGYAATKMLSNYRDHADALETFSGKVNAQVAAHYWRFEVISGRGAGYEGMLLYLQKLHFIKPDKAIEEWNRGSFDALVVPKDRSSAILPELQNTSISPLRSIDRKSAPDIGYVFATRRD